MKNKQTKNQIAWTLKVEMEPQRKKNKIIIRQINEIIGEQSIELGRDTYGVRKKKLANDYRTRKTFYNLKLTEEGGLLLGISLGMPHTSPVLEMENAFVCDGRKH